MNRASLFLALCVPAFVHAAPIALPRVCAALIGKALPQWKYHDVPSDAVKWAEEQGLNPNVTSGDFNADGHLDYAALVNVVGVPHLAVCISHGRTVRLFTVEGPYCSDLVFRSKARKRYYNFETDRHEVLPRDGVSVSCLEKAGATYLYEKGGLRRIIDSD